MSNVYISWYSCYIRFSRLNTHLFNFRFGILINVNFSLFQSQTKKVILCKHFTISHFILRFFSVSLTLKLSNITSRGTNPPVILRIVRVKMSVQCHYWVKEIKNIILLKQNLFSTKERNKKKKIFLWFFPTYFIKFSNKININR